MGRLRFGTVVHDGLKRLYRSCCVVRRASVITYHVIITLSSASLHCAHHHSSVIILVIIRHGLSGDELADYYSDQILTLFLGEIMFSLLLLTI